MASVRKSRVRSTIRGATAAVDAALAQRTQTLLDELGKGTSFLEQWVAHYVAELLARVEAPSSKRRARSEACAELARVVPVLWEQQIAREAVQVRDKVDYQLRRTDKLDADAVELLKGLIANAKSAADLADREFLHALRAMQDLAELATRFLLTSALAAGTGDVASEAVNRFFRRDEELQGLRTALAGIEPGFAALDLANWDAVATLLLQTLLALTRAQLVLLESVADDSRPPSRAGKKASGRKRA